MATRPNDDLIVRIIENPDIKALLVHFSLLIDEIVNFGSLVFEWTFERVHKGDHHLVAFSFYRRSLELLDTIAILIKYSNVSPCKLILRSLFEMLLSLEYMTQRDIEKRGKDYLICLKHKELDFLKKHLSGDPLQREFSQKIAEDELLKGIAIPFNPNIEEGIRIKENLINCGPYSDSENSYQATKLRMKGNPRWWFNLHDGPKDICNLAKKMKRPAQYEILYRNWAGYAHGTGSMDKQVEIEGRDGISIPQLRSPEDADFVTFMAVSYGLAIIQTMIREYTKEKEPEFARWYATEIRADYLGLKEKLISVH